MILCARKIVRSKSKWTHTILERAESQQAHLTKRLKYSWHEYRRYISEIVSSAWTPIIRWGGKTAGSTDERSVSSSTNGVTRNSKADPERRPVNRSSSYAIPFLASQRGSNPSLLRSIDSPYAPLNIHETISGTIEPDLHRFYCVPREDLVVNKFFSLSLSQLPRIPSIPLRSKLRETLFTIALCLLSIVHVYPLAKWSGTKVSRARHNRSLCNVC